MSQNNSEFNQEVKKAVELLKQIKEKGQIPVTIQDWIKLSVQVRLEAAKTLSYGR